MNAYGFLFACALAVSPIGAAVAQDQGEARAEAQVLVNTDAAAILAQQREIREHAVSRTGRYRDMKDGDRQALLSEQDKVLALLEGKARSTELSTPEQLQLFNSLERISAIVNQAEDDRMVCRRERTTGSHRVQNVCRTVAQMRAEQEVSQKAWGNRDGQCEQCGEGSPAAPEIW